MILLGEMFIAVDSQVLKNNLAIYLYCRAGNGLLLHGPIMFLAT